MVEEGGFLYDSDAYDDELPYWVKVDEQPHLVVPYSLTHNDAKFGIGGFATSDDFFQFCKDGFDVLYREGRTRPKMMSVGLHMRLIGHPARAAGLESSRSLGASPWFTFRRVTLPLILPGIAAGAILAFIASLDNVPVSLFLATARTDMLPIRMWGMMESTLDVRVAAVSGVLIAVVLVLMLVMERLVGLTRRIRG